MGCDWFAFDIVRKNLLAISDVVMQHLRTYQAAMSSLHQDTLLLIGMNKTASCDDDNYRTYMLF